MKFPFQENHPPPSGSEFRVPSAELTRNLKRETQNDSTFILADNRHGVDQIHRMPKGYFTF
jgi:hypothetical protein